jgi:hypothetical protein
MVEIATLPRRGRRAAERRLHNRAADGEWAAIERRLAGVVAAAGERG